MSKNYITNGSEFRKYMSQWNLDQPRFSPDFFEDLEINGTKIKDKLQQIDKVMLEIIKIINKKYNWN